MANTDKLEASLIYPREVKIRDGRNVSLRLMEAGDNQSTILRTRYLRMISCSYVPISPILGQLSPTPRSRAIYNA